MKRRVLRWYDYSWSRGRIQGGGDINTALGLLPDKLKTELALHVNLSVLKKVSEWVCTRTSRNPPTVRLTRNFVTQIPTLRRRHVRDTQTLTCVHLTHTRRR